MNKVLKMSIVLVIALFLINNFVIATNINNEGNVIVLGNNTNVNANTNNENTNNVNATNTALNTNNVSVYNNTNTSALPKTGASSSIIIFIGLGIISAVYSLKKMADYNANA